MSRVGVHHLHEVLVGSKVIRIEEEFKKGRKILLRVSLNINY